MRCKFTESCLANNKGVPISTPKPIIQKMNLIGGGTNADTNHIPAELKILWNIWWSADALQEHVFYTYILLQNGAYCCIRECKPP